MRLPEVPVNVIVEAPVAAVEAAVRVRFCAKPGVRVSAEGLAVTPAGRPLSDTATVPVKPFKAFAVTATDCPVAPAVMARFGGVMVSEKSGPGAAAVTVSMMVAE